MGIKHFDCRVGSIIILKQSITMHSAFTLLEVAVVLIVISLLASVTAVEAAFTLIEMSIILVILSLVGSMIMGKIAQDTRRDKAAQLQEKFNRIEKALFAYSKINNGLPCPALPNVDQTNVTFGMQASNPGLCVADASPDSIGVLYSDGADSVGGMLPVITLAPYGLSIEDAADPYGGRFQYVVSKLSTGANVFKTYGSSDTTIGAITVKDGTGANRTSTAVALVLSHGSNGHGAHQLSGVRKSAGSTNVDELLNCHCSATATATAFTSSFTLKPFTNSSASPLDNFDDTGRFYSRSDFKFALLPTPAPAPAPAPYVDILPDSP